MKRILGLDLGTASIGWALVEEAENKEEKSGIIRVGARVNPLTTDEKANFEKGKSITTNADRTLKRSGRRANQRFKLRRDNLKKILIREGWINNDTTLAEHGNYTTFETLRLRAKAAVEEISLEELARVLLMINKKRGYKSNRKADSGDEGQVFDELKVARELKEKGMTPGEYMLCRIKEGQYHVPDFYQSDLREEFDKIWAVQSRFHPKELTAELKKALEGKNRAQTWGVCHELLGVEGMKRTTKGKEQVLENYIWRVKALSEKIGLEELTIVFQEINAQIQKTATYLGKISNRHKVLAFDKKTIGQYLVESLEADPNMSLKNTVFYRQDYADEFERIWETQSKYHKDELTDDLKKKIKDTVIFYQRPLKSMKGLVSICEFENHEQVFEINGKKVTKTIGLKACPKSSPLFQEFKVLQTVNNVTINGQPLSREKKDLLFEELNAKPRMTKTEIRKALGCKQSDQINYEKLEGNSTQATFFEAYSTIIEACGYDKFDFSKMTSADAYEIIEKIFRSLDLKTDFLRFDACMEGDEFQMQPAYRLWHLIYSYEGDKSATGTEGLTAKICQITGFPEEYAKILANITFKPDYGSLSSKAIRKIMPFLKEGYVYSEACEKAGYRHSKSSLTREELDNKVLKDQLEILPKNSLRNPVVEKILNQMVNVVNSVIATYGKPDEIRIELARELKKSAQEREETTDGIAKAEKLNKDIKEKLRKDFGIQNPSSNDVTRYKLYLELAPLGYHTLYSNTYIPAEELFSGKKFDIEHIIAQARLFDDSFSNKTLELRDINIEKGNRTARDYVTEKYGEKGFEAYKNRIDDLLAKRAINKKKWEHLMMTDAEIPSGFIDRDLRDSQYIAKKAKSMLQDIVRDVVSTTGSITARLRDDWQLTNVMQELNWEKYDKSGQTEYAEDKDGRKIKRIKDWTKRNDHRHHAMDAIVIAFTKRSYIQYLNNLNARGYKGDKIPEDVDLRDISLADMPFDKRQLIVRSIEKKQLTRDKDGKMRFIPPIPVKDFREEAQKQLENCLVSIKAKNKVVTKNINRIKKGAGRTESKIQLTPRGQLHNETVYGSRKWYETKEEKVNGTFTAEKISTVANKSYREALLRRLAANDNDPKRAFTGKNSLEKQPLFTDETQLIRVPEKVKTVHFKQFYTIRKPISKDLKIDKVVDVGVKRCLEKRLKEFDGNSGKAFSDLEQNPIWLNKEKGIQIKRVAISGVNNATPLHEKKDNLGQFVLDDENKRVPTDYVSTSNNHHIAIFRDKDGNLQEHVVPLIEAVANANLGLPVIDKEYNKQLGWEFLFTMKINECFVFPNKETGFDPNETDLLDPDNYSAISPNLFRVQKLTTKYYVFRHHLETNVEDKDELRDITWKRIQNVNGLKGIVKVRIDHLGRIVQVGEY